MGGATGGEAQPILVQSGGGEGEGLLEGRHDPSLYSQGRGRGYWRGGTTHPCTVRGGGGEWGGATGGEARPILVQPV